MYRAEFTNARNFFLLLLVEVARQFSLFFRQFLCNVRNVLAPYLVLTRSNYPCCRKKRVQRTIFDNFWVTWLGVHCMMWFKPYSDDFWWMYHVNFDITTTWQQHPTWLLSNEIIYVIFRSNYINQKFIHKTYSFFDTIQLDWFNYAFSTQDKIKTQWFVGLDRHQLNGIESKQSKNRR